MRFPERLKEERIRKGLTQEELAKKIFVSRTLITKYESGSAIPSKENIEKLALALGIKIADLVDPEDSTLLTLEYARYSLISNYWFNIIAIVINAIWIIVATIPMFGTWKYIYPMPDGATQPEKEYYVFSLIRNSLAHGNFVVLCSLLVSTLFIAITLVFFLVKNKKAHFALIWVVRILFVICLFMILFGLFFGLGNADL